MKCRKRSGDEVISYTQEEREAALNVSMTSLAASLGYTPLRTGSHFQLKEMDSLVIYNDRSWNRWSGKGRITGGTQIDFMLEYGGALSVPDAIMRLLDYSGEGMVAAPQVSREPSSVNDGFSMKLPPKNENYRRIYAYLIQTRGLSQEIVSDFVHRRLIYEDSEHHNIVYCGRDPEGNIRYAGLRGTGDIYGKTFKMDIPGNNKNYGVNIVNDQSDELKVFESVIDCMSYIDIYGDHTSNKLVLGMVEDNPLAQFLRDYSHIRRITFCLDNDEAADKALHGRTDAGGLVTKKGLLDKYKEQGYLVSTHLPENGKDFNEMLLQSKANARIGKTVGIDAQESAIAHAQRRKRGR